MGLESTGIQLTYYILFYLLTHMWIYLFLEMQKCEESWGWSPLTRGFRETLTNLTNFPSTKVPVGQVPLHGQITLGCFFN